MCATKSSDTMSIRNYAYGSKILISVPVTFISRDVSLYHSRDILNTNILYKQKLQTHNYLLCYPKFEAYKKTKKSNCQRKQNKTKTWQFPSQLCVEANAAQIMCC